MNVTSASASRWLYMHLISACESRKYSCRRSCDAILDQFNVLFTCYQRRICKNESKYSRVTWRCCYWCFSSSIFLSTIAIETRACVRRSCLWLSWSMRIRAKKNRKLRTTHQKTNSGFLLFPWDGRELARGKLFTQLQFEWCPNDGIRRVMFIFNVVRQDASEFVFVHYVLGWRAPHNNIFLFWLHEQSEENVLPKTRTPFKSTNHSASFDHTLTLLFDDDNRRCRLRATSQMYSHLFDALAVAPNSLSMFIFFADFCYRSIEYKTNVDLIKRQLS